MARLLSSPAAALVGRAGALLLLHLAGAAQGLKTDFIQAQGPVYGVNLTINSNFAYGIDLSKDGSVMAVGAPNYPLTQNFGTGESACKGVGRDDSLSGWVGSGGSGAGMMVTVAVATND